MIFGASDGFEIVVKKERNSFTATCSIFPEIIGTGKDEAKAIEALADGLSSKIGNMLKSTLDGFLKKDLLHLLRSEARIYKDVMAKARKNSPRIVPKKNQPVEHKMIFNMPPINNLLRSANLSLDKSNPLLRGLIMVLGLHSLQKKPANNPYLGEREYFENMNHMEEQMFMDMVDSGMFNSMQPTGQRTPFGLTLGIPMSFN